MSGSQTKVCPNCGTQNPEEANFCRKCRYDFRTTAGGNGDPVPVASSASASVPGIPTTIPTPSGATTKSKELWIALCVLVLLILSVPIYIWIQKGASDKEVIDNVVENYQPESYSGVYSMKMISGENTSVYVVVVESFAVDRYRMEVVTEYGKEIYTFTVMEDGSVVSPELGKAKVEYKRSIDKLSLEFTGVNLRCVLTK